MTDISAPIAGSELGPEFDIGEAVPNKITLRVGEGVTRNPDGSIVIDVPFMQNLIGPTDTGGSGMDRVTAIGFDEATETLTLTLADGAQVTGGLIGVVTESQLAAEKVSVRSVFGSEFTWRALPA